MSVDGSGAAVSVTERLKASSCECVLLVTQHCSDGTLSSELFVLAKILVYVEICYNLLERNNTAFFSLHEL